MAKAGRKPKPPQLKVVEGNPGKRPIPTNYPKPPPEAPRQPRWSTHLPGKRNKRVREWAKAEWDRVVPVLDRLGLLSSLDRALIIDYCLCWGRLVQCERDLAEDGLVVATPQGSVKSHPLLNAASGYRSQLRFYVGELGLGPSSRGRLQIPGEPDDDEDLFDT